MAVVMNNIEPVTGPQLLVCRGTGCESQKAGAIQTALEESLKTAGLADKVGVTFTGCHGLCQMGPTVLVVPQGTFYCKVKSEDAAEIVGAGFVNGNRVERLLFKDAKTKEHVADYRDIDFFRSQTRVVLRNCGLIDPENLDEYLRVGGIPGNSKGP